jgi:hypothetical protein
MDNGTQESKQTSLPVCMHKMHKNYSWNSKVVSNASVCNRVQAASVDSRDCIVSSIAKVLSWSLLVSLVKRPEI